MRRAVDVIAASAVNHPNVGIRLSSLLRVGPNRVAEQAQSGQAAIEGGIEEMFMQRKAARYCSHQRLAYLLHAAVIDSHRFAPAEERDCRRQRCGFTQRIIAANDRRTMDDVATDVDAFLGGQKALLQRKPSAIDIRVGRIELLAPELTGLVLRQLKHA